MCPVTNVRLSCYDKAPEITCPSRLQGGGGAEKKCDS